MTSPSSENESFLPDGESQEPISGTLLSTSGENPRAPPGAHLLAFTADISLDSQKSTPMEEDPNRPMSQTTLHCGL